MGCLSKNITDDGRGKARAMVFHHKHELETGRSSAVTCELMGFCGDKPMPVDVKASRQKIWQHVHDHAERSVSFIDLCGHERYLKTTIFGLTALLPDYGEPPPPPLLVPPLPPPLVGEVVPGPRARCCQCRHEPSATTCHC